MYNQALQAGTYCWAKLEVSSLIRARAMNPHGLYEFNVCGSTLVATVRGTWNKECAEEWAKDYRKFVIGFAGKPWASLTDLTDWELSTPEIWPIVDEVNVWAMKQGQKYDVVVCSMEIQKSLIQRANGVFEDVETAIFDHRDEAIAWLKTRDML